jgi:hypothetical protein
MAKCIKCGAETQLYDAGVPICINCSDQLEARRTEREQEREFRLIGTEVEPYKASADPTIR